MPEQPSPGPSEWVQVRLEGRIGHLELRRPEKKNAISSAMAWHLLEGLRELEADERCHVVVLSGDGGVFSSGADMSEVRDAASSEKWADNPGAQLLRVVAEAKLPVVAVVDGWAIGLALGLLGAATYVVADEAARFSLPEIHDGYLPHGVIPFLVNRMSPETVVEWALTGAAHVTAEAAAAGLVTHPVTDGGAREAAAALADRLAHAPRPQLQQAMGFLRETRASRGATRVQVWCDRQMDLLLQADQ